MATSPPLATINHCCLGGAPNDAAATAKNGLLCKKLPPQWSAASIAIMAVVADFFVAPHHETVREEW